MSWFSKYIIFSAIMGIVGIPLFILNFTDLSWQTNKETYWGLLALIFIIIAALVEHKAKSIKNRK